MRGELPLLDKNRFPEAIECTEPSLNSWSERSNLQVPFYFMTATDIDLSDVLDKLRTFLELEQTTRFHFHGTSWAFSQDIIRDGILLTASKNKTTDFGLRCFYVGDSLQLAYRWAKMKGSGYAAVLCYRFDDVQSFPEKESLAFTESVNWRTTVYKFRKSFNELSPYVVEMIEYDLMSGPICALYTAKLRKIEDVQPLNYNNRVAFQTAVRNPSTATQMNEKLVGVIFFPLA